MRVLMKLVKLRDGPSELPAQQFDWQPRLPWIHIVSDDANFLTSSLLNPSRHIVLDLGLDGDASCFEVACHCLGSEQAA